MCTRGVRTKEESPSLRGNEETKIQKETERDCFFLRRRFNKKVGGTGVEMRKERALYPGEAWELMLCLVGGS